MAKIETTAANLQWKSNMIKYGDNNTPWTDDYYPSAYAVVEKINKSATSLPVGSILITSTNENPSTKVGGSWQLIDKEYKPAVGSNVYWTSAVSGSAPLVEVMGFVTRTGHSIQLHADITTKDRISSASNSITLGKFDHTMIGGLTNTPISFGYFGSSIATAVYTSDGSTTESCSIRYSLDWNGSLAVYEIFNANKQLPAGTKIYLNVPILMDPEYMGDSFCDKFYWKRLATQASVSEPIKTTVGFGFNYTLKADDTYEVSGLGGCPLTDFAIPSIYLDKPVTSIGYEAFYNCSSLTTIVIPDSVTSIGFGAFDNTAYYNNTSNWENGVLYISNHLIKVNADILISTVYNVKDGTKTIADYAFSGLSGLFQVTIPSSVTSIGEGAFEDCHYINVITFNGTVSQWNAIIKGTNWASHLPDSCEVRCTDGTLTIAGTWHS